MSWVPRSSSTRRAPCDYSSYWAPHQLAGDYGIPRLVRPDFTRQGQFCSLLSAHQVAAAQDAACVDSPPVAISDDDLERLGRRVELARQALDGDEPRRSFGHE
ncbi:MAG TPA: hypothetical protein VHU62_02180 [Mycobacterium sp.]|nr:hypothetical protein [Mycobacterium sp.]